jgi:uncharacterized protein (TIGR03437 family)
MKHAVISILICICAFGSLPAWSQDASANIITSAGYLYPTPATVAPGQVITLFVANAGPGQVGVTLQQGQSYTVPVLSVGTPANCPDNQIVCAALSPVTIQIPYEMRLPCPLAEVCPSVLLATNLFVTQNGAAGPAISLTPVYDRMHILTSCDTLVSGGGIGPTNGLPCAPLVTHADGSLVTAQSPAQGNEELVAYAVGLGATNPASPTGQTATLPAPTQQNFLLSFDFMPNALPAQPVYPMGALLTTYASPRFSGLVPGYVGLYQINFVVPPPGEITACGDFVQSNLTVNIGGQSSFDGAGICVVPGQ